MTSETDEFAGGSGTQQDPYLVATADQLNNVRKYLDQHFKQIAHIDLSCPVPFKKPMRAKLGV